MSGVTTRVLPDETLRDVAARELARLHPEAAGDDAASVITAVLDVILSEPVRTELARAITSAQQRADDAFNVRDDLYDSWDGPEPRARLSLLAVDHAFGRSVDHERGMTVEEAEAILAHVSYKADWHFSVDRLPSGPIGVRVEARGLPDTSGRRTTVAAARRCWDRGSLLANAMGAVEALEVHEAREHFRYQGDTIFNEHRGRDDDFEPPMKDDLPPL